MHSLIGSMVDKIKGKFQLYRSIWGDETNIQGAESLSQDGKGEDE